MPEDQLIGETPVMVEAQIFEPASSKVWRIGYNLLKSKFAGTVLADAIGFNAGQTRALIGDNLPRPDESASKADERLLLYRLENIAVTIRLEFRLRILMFDPPRFPLARIIRELSDDPFDRKAALVGWVFGFSEADSPWRGSRVIRDDPVGEDLQVG